MLTCLEIKNSFIGKIIFTLNKLTSLTLPNISNKFIITIQNNVDIITINTVDLIEKLTIFSKTKINLITKPKIIIISEQCQLFIFNNYINKSPDYMMRKRGEYHLKNINSI